MAPWLREQGLVQLVLDLKRKKKHDVKKRIAEHLDSFEAVECSGKRIFYKSSRRTSFDTKRFKSERPDEYYKYVKETETARSLRIYNITNPNNMEAK